MSGGGGFRGRGFGSHGYRHQGPGPDLSGSSGSRSGSGSRQSGPGGPRLDGSGTRPPGPNSRSDGPNSRLGGPGFNAHGGGPPRGPCPNFNATRRPPRHPVRPSDNWSPRGGPPHFPPWRGGHSPRFNGPPRPFFRGRGQGPYMPRFPFMPAGNYPPPYMQFPPVPEPKPVEQKQVVPHLGSEEERQQKITEAADALKLKLSTVAKEPDVWREDENEGLAEFSRDADHDSRITNKGIPELKHHPPELNLTLGDLRDIGRVDHDHRTEQTKTNSENEDNFACDESEVEILAHYPVRPMIEIDLWSDDNYGEYGEDECGNRTIAGACDMQDTSQNMQRGGQSATYDFQSFNDNCTSCADDVALNDYGQAPESKEHVEAATEQETPSIEAVIKRQNEVAVECITQELDAGQQMGSKRSDGSDNMQEVARIDSSADKTDAERVDVTSVQQDEVSTTNGPDSGQLHDEMPQFDNVPGEHRKTVTEAREEMVAESRGDEAVEVRDNLDKINVNERISGFEGESGGKADENAIERLDKGWVLLSSTTQDDATRIPGLDGLYTDENIEESSGKTKTKNDNRSEIISIAESAIDESKKEPNNIEGLQSKAETAIVEKEIKESRIESTSENLDRTIIQRSAVCVKSESRVGNESESRKGDTSRETRHETSKANRDEKQDRVFSELGDKVISEAKQDAITTKSHNATVRERPDVAEQKIGDKIADEGPKERNKEENQEKSRDSESQNTIDKAEIATSRTEKRIQRDSSKKTDSRDETDAATKVDAPRKKSEAKIEKPLEVSLSADKKAEDREATKQEETLSDQKIRERRKLVRTMAQGAVMPRNRSRTTVVPNVPVDFDPREPPPMPFANNFGISASTKRQSKESNILSVPADFDPKQPPPKLVPSQDIAEAPQIPPAFDPRLSSLDRSILIGAAAPISSAIPVPQDFGIKQGYHPRTITNFSPCVPAINYGPPPIIMGTTVLSLPNVPVAAPISTPANTSLVLPPLPTEPPPPLPPLGKSNLDMDDGLEDMQEAMEFAKQLMNMDERRGIVDETNSVDSDFFHMPTFPDLPPVELSPLFPNDIPTPLEAEKGFVSRQTVTNKDCKKSKSSKNEPVSYGPQPMPEELRKNINSSNEAGEDGSSEKKGDLTDEQIRPKVMFNLSSKTKVINKDNEWQQQQHREEAAEAAAAAMTTISSSEIGKHRKNKSPSSPAVTATSKEKIRVTNGQEDRKKLRNAGEKSDSKALKFNGNNSQMKKPEESHSHSRSRSQSPARTKQAKHSRTDNPPMGDTERNHISSRRVTKESISKKSTNETPESSWKSRVIGRFLKMSKNDICNMLNNTSLRKFDIAMKHLVKERRSSLSFGMRNNEEEKLKDTDVSYNREEFMDQLSAMLDPSATVDVCNLPTQFIHHLSEVLQLDTMTEFEAGLTPTEYVEAPASTPPRQAPRQQPRLRRESVKAREIDDRRPCKREREKKSMNAGSAVETSAATTLPTIAAETRRSLRLCGEAIASKCAAKGENIVQEVQKNPATIVPRARRQRQQRSGIPDQPAVSSAITNGSTEWNLENPSSLNMTDLDDIFSAGIARAKNKAVQASKNEKIVEKFEKEVNLGGKEAVRDVASGKDPSVDRVERAAVELDKIFTAGIARAKLASKKAAAAAAKAAEANDGDDDEDDGDWKRADGRSNLIANRARHRSMSRHITKCEKWSRRKAREDPDAFRNLTKEEWEAKYGETSDSTYEREYRAMVAMRARKAGRSPTSLREDHEGFENEETGGIMSRLGNIVTGDSGHTEAWSDGEDDRRLQNINDPPDYLIGAYNRSSEDGSSSSSTSSTSSGSSEEDDEETPSVTKLLKVIKAREKIGKKKSMNEEIRDEVTAEIERKRRERGKVSRKGHRSRTKKSHRRKKDRKVKVRERKKRERKRKKRKSRRSGSDQQESSGNEDTDEEGTSSGLRSQQPRQLLTEQEIKKEDDVIVVKDEPENANEPPAAAKLRSKSALAMRAIDDSHSPSTSFASSTPAVVGASAAATPSPVVYQTKTKAQLKQLPGLPTGLTLKKQEMPVKQDPKENANEVVASSISDAFPVVSEPAISSHSSNKVSTRSSVQNHPVANMSSELTTNSKKLDFNTYKERTRLRLLRENEKLQFIHENPSSLTQNLLNIPLTRKKVVEKTEPIAQTVELRKDPRLARNDELSSTTIGNATTCVTTNKIATSTTAAKTKTIINATTTAPTISTTIAKTPTISATVAKTSTISATVAKTSTISTTTAKTPTINAIIAKASTISTTTAKTPTISTSTAKTSTISTATAKTPIISTTNVKSSEISTTSVKTSAISSTTVKTLAISSTTAKTPTINTATVKSSGISSTTAKNPTISATTAKTSTINTTTALTICTTTATVPSTVDPAKVSSSESTAAQQPSTTKPPVKKLIRKKSVTKPALTETRVEAGKFAHIKSEGSKELKLREKLKKGRQRVSSEGLETTIPLIQLPRVKKRSSITITPTAEESATLPVNQKIEDTKKSPVTQRYDYFKKGIVSDGLPDTVPQELLPVFRREPTNINQLLLQQAELDPLPLPIAELSSWPLDPPISTSIDDEIDSDDSPPFKGFAEAPILRRDRVLTEAELNAEIDALDAVPLAFEAGADTLPMSTVVDLNDLRSTVLPLDQLISYGDEEFVEGTVEIETTLLGFPVTDDIPDDPEAIGALGDDVFVVQHVERSPEKFLEESRESLDILPRVTSTLRDSPAPVDFLIADVRRRESIPSPILVTESIRDENEESLVSDLSTNNIEEKKKKETSICDDAAEVTSSHESHNNTTGTVSPEVTVADFETSSSRITSAAGDKQILLRTKITKVRDEDKAKCASETQEMQEKRAIIEETSAKDALLRNLTLETVHTPPPQPSSSSDSTEERRKETAIEKQRDVSETRDSEIKSKESSQHGHSKSREHGHGKTKRKSSRHHNHGPRSKKKGAITEKMVEEAVAANIVKLVPKPTSKETVMARMIEIDVEIHKLMNEKMTLYKMLESGEFPAKEEVVEASSAKANVEPKASSETEEIPEIVPPTVLASRLVRNLDKAVLPTPATMHNEGPRKSHMRIGEAEDEGRKSKRKKSPQREGKNRAKDSGSGDSRRSRKISESKIHSRRTTSEESSRHESMSTHSREKSTSSTELEDGEEKSHKRKTMSLQRHSPNGQSSKRSHEHSSKEDLRDGFRESTDRSIKSTKQETRNLLEEIPKSKLKKKTKNLETRKSEETMKARKEEKKSIAGAKVTEKSETSGKKATGDGERGAIYSDESTWDSLDPETIQGEEQRGKKDGTANTGLALLEESFKREMAETRKLKAMEKRKSSKQELRRILLDPTTVTPDEEETSLRSDSLDRKRDQKKDKSGNTSEDPVKVWKHVTTVIDAVAANCIEQLYNDETSSEPRDSDRGSSPIRDSAAEEKIEESVPETVEGAKKTSEPDKDELAEPEEPEKAEETKTADPKDSAAISEPVEEGRTDVEETTEVSDAEVAEDRENTSVVTKTISGNEDLPKTQQDNISSEENTSESPQIDTLVEESKEKAEIEISGEESAKQTVVDDHNEEESAIKASINGPANGKEEHQSSTTLNKSERVADQGEEMNDKKTKDSRSPSLDVPPIVSKPIENREFSRPRAEKKREKEEEPKNKISVNESIQESMNSVEKAPGGRKERRNAKEAEAERVRSKIRNGRSGAQRGVVLRDTPPKENRSNDSEKHNSSKAEESKHHAEKPSTRPRSATKRRQREKSAPPNRKTSRYSEDNGKSSRSKKREKSSSRGTSPHDGEPARKKNHPRRSSSPLIQVAANESQTRRRGRKRKRRPEISREEMSSCKVLLIDCKYTYLSPNMHPRILKKLGISKINPYTAPKLVAETVAPPKLSRVETPSPSNLSKVEVSTKREEPPMSLKDPCSSPMEFPPSPMKSPPSPKEPASSPMELPASLKEPGSSPLELPPSPKQSASSAMESPPPPTEPVSSPKEPPSSPMECPPSPAELPASPKQLPTSPTEIGNRVQVDEDDDEDDETDDVFDETIHIVKVADENLPLMSQSEDEEVEGVVDVVEDRAAPPDSTADDIAVDDENEDNAHDDSIQEADTTDDIEVLEEKITSADNPTDLQELPESDAEDKDLEPRRTRYTVHKGPILDIKVLDDSFLAASEDGAIYRYSHKSNGILNIYKGHEAAVTCIYVLEMSGKRWTLYSGSLDGTFRCYDITTGLQDRPPADVGSPVQCMDQAWGVIFVGTKSGHISRYNIKSGSIKGDRLEFSDKSVLALKASSEGPRRVLIVASRNQPITIRDALTGLFLRTICGYKNHTVYSLMRERNLVYCGTSSTSIPVFDFTNGEQITQYSAGVGIVCMRLYRQILFAGCYDGNIYVFDTKETRLICSIPGPGNMLLSMEIVGNEIIAGSKNRQLHSWRMPRQVRALLSERT